MPHIVLSPATRRPLVRCLLVVAGAALVSVGCDSPRVDELTAMERAQTSRPGLTEEQQRMALEKHNALRARVARGDTPGQPPAADMKRLTWDDDLAAVAQQWANTCTYRHNEQRSEQLDARTQRDEPDVGENLFAFLGTLSGPSVDDAIQAWFDEHELYTFPNAPTPATGHYTQLVWADTTRVGCGYARCDDLDHATFADMPPRAEGFLFVCDYAPAGNWIGQAPYTVGDACSACGHERARCVEGLCSFAVDDAGGAR